MCQLVRHQTLMLTSNGDSWMKSHFLWLVRKKRHVTFSACFWDISYMADLLHSPKHCIYVHWILQPFKVLSAETDGGTTELTGWNVWNYLNMLSVNAYFGSSGQLFSMNKALKTHFTLRAQHHMADRYSLEQCFLIFPPGLGRQWKHQNKNV